MSSSHTQHASSDPHHQQHAHPRPPSHVHFHYPRNYQHHQHHHHHHHHAPEPEGAAQFLTNLSERQRAHLQFAVLEKDTSARSSHYLEEPRGAPVPNRFTFDALDAESRRLRDSASTTRTSSRLRYSDTTKSSASKSSKHVRDDSASTTRTSRQQQHSDAAKSSASNHTRDDSGQTSDSGTSSTTTTITAAKGRSRATSLVPSLRPSLDLVKEVELFKEAVDEVDWRFYATGCCICLVNLVMAWDATAISIALPTIATALHGSAIAAFWLGISFLVAATAFLPLFSAFSEIFGRKAMLLAGLLFFTTGSMIVAWSASFKVLHLGRSVQGVGAGGVFVLSDLIVTDLVSPLDKRRWSATLGAMWAIGAVTGPVLGEALAERNQWRWIFWLNIPFCIMALAILPFFAQLKTATPGAILPKLRAFDWIGFVLLTGSLVSMLLGISRGGTLHTWSSPGTLLPLQFGLIGIVVFCVWSWFAPFRSVISLEGCMDRTSLATYFGATIQGGTICAFLYFMPFYFGVAKPELNDLPAGVRWFPWTLPLVVILLITFLVISRWNTWLPAIWLGWVLVLTGVSLTTLYARTSPTGTWVGIAIVLGSGVGILYPSLHTASELIAAQTQGDGKTARAVTNYTFFQLLGKSFGVAIATSIFENEFRKRLQSNHTFTEFAVEYTTDAVALVARVRATTGGDGSPKAQIADAYIGSLKIIWIVMAVFAGLALLVSCFMMPREVEAKHDIELKNLDESYAV